MLRFRSCSCRQRDQTSDLTTPGSERSEAAQVAMVRVWTDSFFKRGLSVQSCEYFQEASVHVRTHVGQRTSVSINVSAENQCF